MIPDHHISPGMNYLGQIFTDDFFNRRQVITWTNTYLLLIGPLEQTELLIEINVNYVMKYIRN